MFRPVGKRLHARSIGSRINRRTRDFLAGNWEKLHFDAVNSAREHRVKRRSNQGIPLVKEEELTSLIRRARVLCEAGRWSKGLASLESLGALPYELLTLQRFAAKFPSGMAAPHRDDVDIDAAVREGLMPCGAREPLSFSDFKKSLKALPSHTAADALGFYADWFRSFLFKPVRRAGLTALHQSCSALAAGEPSDLIKGVLFASRGAALKKPDDKIRPVCVTGILRKITSGALLAQYKDKIVARLEESHQYGLSRDGNLKVITAIRALLERATAADFARVVMTGDVENAFSSVSRFAVIEALREIAPGLIPFVVDIYGRTNLVRFRRDDLEDMFSSDVWNYCGVQQGCTFGSALFCLATLKSIDILRSEFCDNPDTPEAEQCRFLHICDDGYIVGPPLRALAMAARWEELLGLGDHTAASPEPALAIKPGKSHVFSTVPLGGFDGFSLPTPLRPYALFGSHKVHPPTTGLGILGAYVGAPEWVEAQLMHETQSLIGRFYRLELIAHDLYLVQQLIPMCYLPRFTHLLRCHPPALVRKASEFFDAVTMAVAEKLYAIGKLDAERASFPRRAGGAGLRNQTRTSHGAYFAGCSAGMDSGAFLNDPDLCLLLPSLDSDPGDDEIPMLTALRKARATCIDYGAVDYFADRSLSDAVRRASKKGAQKSITAQIEQRAVDVYFPDVAPDCGLLDRLQRRCRYHNVTGRHVAGKFKTPRAFLPSEQSNAGVKFMLRMHLDLPLALEANLCGEMADGSLKLCPACNKPMQRDHILSCAECATSKRFAKHQAVSLAFIAIVRLVELFPWAGAGGGGPLLRERGAFSRGSDVKNMRTDVEVGGVVGQYGTVHVDFTVVAGSGGPMCADPNDVLQAARSGAHDPDFFVVEKGDKPKMRKYVDICRDAGFTFIPLAMSTGGRTSPEGLRLLKLIYATVEDRVDSWYFYGVLLPRLYAALALGQYQHSVAIRRAFDAKRAAKRRGASGSGWCPADGDSMPAPPSPSAANARYDFVDSVDSDMDGRWGSNADGSCTYDHERASEYSAFLREVHSEFFASE
jgi:hypothetical protein